MSGHIRRTSVGFLRPWMEIGGSERLVADAAVALKRRGCDVTLFVPSRANVVHYPDVADSQIACERAGAFIPTDIAGRLRVPMAIARTAYAGWRMAQSRRCPDVIFSDVVPHVIPLVKRLVGRPVLYFCHYPDLLLTRDRSRESASYRAYRRPLDRMEGHGVAAADVVVTNSRFTSNAVREAFPDVPATKLSVLYPGVPVPAQPQSPAEAAEATFLSVSRFDPRKNLQLAVEALAALRTLISTEAFAPVRLVLAGHYDQRLPEAVELVGDLERLAGNLGLRQHVRFVFSPDERERLTLLSNCRAVIYTPAAEHFGYVPLEAMATGRAVIAVNNAGPAETIVDGATGLLCEPTPHAFAAALAIILLQPEMAVRLGTAGHDHVARNFSLDNFGNGLHELVNRLARGRTGKTSA